MPEHPREWTGKTLAEDLALTFQSENLMAWVNLPLGQMGFSQIADVLTLNKSFVNAVIKIYEVKVDRQDFFGDVNREKYKGYFKSAHFVYFAIPQGLVKVADLPQDGVGLIVRGDSGWHVAKASRRSPYQIDIELLLKLLMRGYEDHWQKHRSEDIRKQQALVYTTLEQASYSYGVKVAKDIAQAQGLKAWAETFLKEVSTIMGVDYLTPPRGLEALQQDVQRLMLQRKAIRLALPLAILALQLFDGELFYSNPTRRLKEILIQFEKEFPDA